MSLKSSYYRQLLKSYLLVIFVPMAIMCLLLYQMGVRSLRSEILREQQALMTLSSANLTRRLNETDEQLQALLNDDLIVELSRFEAEEAGIRHLAAYVAHMPALDDLAVLPSQSDWLYTTQGTRTLDAMLSETWKLSEREIASWRTYVSDRRDHLHYFRDGGALLRILPLPQGGCLIATLSKALLSDVVSLDELGGFGALVLCDNHGQALYSSDKDGLLLTSGLRETAFSAQPQAAFSHQGRSYWAQAVTITDTNWQLLSIIPRSVLRSRMHISYLFLAVAGSLLLSAVLALVAARRQYKPIQRLSAMAEDENYAANELESISTRLDVSRSLSQTALTQRRLLIESVVFRLLQGRGAGWDEALMAMQALGMLSDTEMLTVVRIRFFATPQPLSHDALLDYIHTRYARQDRAYAIEMALNGEPAVAMVLKLISPVPEEEIKAVANDLSIFVQHQMKIGCFFGVGSMVPLSQIATSYLEASIALEHTMDADAQRIIRFSDLSDITLEIDPQFQRAMMLFIHGLKNTDEANPQALLDQLLLQLDGYAGKALWQFYAFSLAEALVQLVNDEHSARFRKEADSPRIASLLTIALSASDPQEYNDLIRQATELMLAASQAWDQQQADSTQDRIGRWLDENLTNPLLSLEMMTDVFGFSSTYWSRYFSEQLGTPFNDLVWHKRCELFKERLTSTSRPIKGLVNEVGYVDVSSFSRRFKLEEGLTPGQWRQLHQKA